MAEIKTQIYSIATDELRDVTDNDIEQWKDADAFAGIRIPMQRALIIAEQKLWRREITVNQLWQLKKAWMEFLQLDSSGK